MPVVLLVILIVLFYLRITLIGHRVEEIDDDLELMDYFEKILSGKK